MLPQIDYDNAIVEISFNLLPQHDSGYVSFS